MSAGGPREPTHGCCAHADTAAANRPSLPPAPAAFASGSAQARTQALAKAFEAMDAIAGGETDSDEVWRQVMQGIDESRPHRPLFEGAY